MSELQYIRRSGAVYKRRKLYFSMQGRKKFTGNGYLAGDYPGGITTVEGTPVGALVRVIFRDTAGSIYDGVVVAEARSAPDGTWRVDGLNPNLRYDVVGRKSGFNDVIVSNVQPVV